MKAARLKNRPVVEEPAEEMGTDGENRARYTFEYIGEHVDFKA